MTRKICKVARSLDCGKGGLQKRELGDLEESTIE